MFSELEGRKEELRRLTDEKEKIDRMIKKSQEKILEIQSEIIRKVEKENAK